MKVLGGAFGLFAVLALVAALMLDGPQAQAQKPAAQQPAAAATTAATTVR